MRGIKRASPYIAAGAGFCGLGGGLYYMFVERGYKVEGPKTDIPGSIEEFLKKLMEWLQNHMGGGNPGKPPGGNPGTPDASSANVTTSQYSSSSQSSEHFPVELLPLVAVAMVIIMAIGYGCYASQKASPPMGGR